MKNDIKRGNVYLADLDPVKGSEQGGIRPVVVIQNDMGNIYSPTVIIAAITSKNKKELPTHVKIRFEGLPGESTVMLEQVRTIDKNRLLRYVGTLEKTVIDQIVSALKVSLDIEQ